MTEKEICKKYKEYFFIKNEYENEESKLENEIEVIKNEIVSETENFDQKKKEIINNNKFLKSEKEKKVKKRQEDIQLYIAGVLIILFSIYYIYTIIKEIKLVGIFDAFYLIFVSPIMLLIWTGISAVIGWGIATIATLGLRCKKIKFIEIGDLDKNLERLNKKVENLKQTLEDKTKDYEAIKEKIKVLENEFLNLLEEIRHYECKF